MISRKVVQDTDLSITVGIGPTLSLAKLAKKRMQQGVLNDTTHDEYFSLR